LRLEIIDVMNAMKLPVAAGLAMYMSVLLLKGNLAHHFQQVLGLVVLVLGGALIYSAVMLLFNRNGIREIMNLARS
jgi:hypothetical protein